MKKIVFLLIVLNVSAVISQTLNKKLEGQLAKGMISGQQALYLEAVSVHAPAHLPAEYAEFDLPVRKSAFALNYRLQKAWPAFSRDQQAVLEHVLQRPVMQADIISPSGLFRIHYDISGYNAVSLDDYNGNAIPDYVEEAADIMDYVYNVEINQLGLQSPPDDRGGGETAEWDIYITNVGSQIYGYINEDFPPLSLNPTVYSSYMVLDNSYSHTPTTGMDGLRVTAAHEFFHMVQLGYNGRDDNDDGWFDDLFLMEAGSTWMEDVVFDHINDYLFYLEDFFQSTNVRFDYVNNWREYGLCVWYHFLEARLGTRAFMPLTWEAIVEVPGLEATGRVLEQFSTTFEEELPVFYGWNYFTGFRADVENYYPEGDTYPMMVLDGYFALTQDTSLTDTVNATAAKYYQFMEPNENTYTIIPTHSDLTPGIKKDGFRLALGRGAGWEEYVRLGNVMRTRLITDNPAAWSGMAVVEIPGIPAEMVSLNDLYTPPVLVNLPAVYPNPFVLQNHAETHIPFKVSERKIVRISLFTPSGVPILETKMEAYAGSNEYLWNGLNGRGEQVASGIYLYYITADNEIIRKDKVVVIR